MPTTHAMTDPTARELFDEIARWPIYDPHTHINPHRPAARHWDEILGYHYYTELAHSTGMPVEMVSPELPPAARVANVITYLDRIDSTVQYSWLLEIARTFYRFAHDRITPANCGELLDRADHESTVAPGTTRCGGRAIWKRFSSRTSLTTRSKGGIRGPMFPA